jgi:hypothetical protein
MATRSVSFMVAVLGVALIPASAALAGEYKNDRIQVEGVAPVRTGSAGNSHTGPGYNPAYGRVFVNEGPVSGVRDIESDAPVRTGSAGNSNTGPGFDPTYGRETIHTGRPSRTITVESDAPVRTGSAGNSNTGPGFDPAYSQTTERLR